MPGGGTGGGTGRSVSGCTHADRSKNRNSSAFSWGDRVTDVHPLGNGVPSVPGSDLSRLSPDATGPALTWMSVWTTRPHCASAAASTGVLNVMYCVEVRWGVTLSFGFVGR